MSVNIESTTDSKEQVLAAIGGAKSETVEQKQSVSSNDEQSEQDETSEESDPSEDNLDDNNSDSSVSEDDEEITDELKEDQKPKKRSGFQRRIEKFQKKLSEKDQEIERLRAEVSGARKPHDNVQAESVQQPKIEAEGKPDPAKFDSHEEYVDALTDWKINSNDRAKEVKAKELELKNEYQKQVSTFQSKVADFSKTVADFDEIVSDVDDVQLNHSIQDSILSSDYGPQLMYELSKNREELVRINNLNPIAAAREIGRLEARIGNGLDKSKPREQRITNTPPPIDPVGSKSTGKTFKSPDDMDFQEYKKWRAANKS